MLNRYVNQGRADALHRFGLAKLASQMELPGMGAPAAAPAGSGMLGRAKAFGSGQLGAAKDLFGNMRQGLGGAATPELGQAARGAAMGNLKTLAPSLLAGGALYAMHRHNQAQREQQARQQAMMGGGYPTM